MEANVKITVIAKLDTGDILKTYQNTVIGPCPAFKVGDEFIVEALEKPQGFCSWAWADIQRDVALVALGGDIYWNKCKGTSVVCCTDGMRPVVFKLERLE